MSALTFCVASRLQLRTLHARLHDLQTKPVVMDDAHCALRLQALQRLGSWADLGFQGKDPCTDFRGSGQLGLESIHVMQQSIPDAVLRMLLQSRDSGGQTAYPFACAVINVVHRCFAALRHGHLDAAMHCSGYHAIAFHGVVAHAMCRSVFRARSSEYGSMCRVSDANRAHARPPLQASRLVDTQSGSLPLSLCATSESRV